MKRPTLADVARHSGFSTATVSMALNGRPDSRLPEATIAQVKAAADELGYVSDHNARSLRTGRSRTLGFISSEITITRFASEMLGGLLDSADQAEHAVMMMEVDRREDRLARALKLMRSRRLDALAIGLMDARLIDIPELTADLPKLIVNGRAAGWHSLLADNEQAGQQAVEYLVARGHRRIGMVGRHPSGPVPEVSVSIGERFAGIDRAMAAAGLSFAAEAKGAVWEPELGYQGALTVLDQAPDITAILAANDRIAFGVYQALAERGLAIPGDISVLSFDDEELGAMVRPGLTTLRLPYREMGEIAVQRLVAALSDGTAIEPDATEFVPLELVERTSVKSI